MRLAALAQVGGRTFASVRKHRNYRLYFTGQAVSFTGTWMQQIAASWLVLQLTHSAVAVGTLALAQLLPISVLGLFIGTILDRHDVRRVAIATETAALVLAALLAALTLSHAVRVWEIYVLAVLQGVIQSIDAPARQALVFQMVGPEDLANAVALNSSLGTTARILGPAMGGPLIAVAGAGVAFALNSASFVAELGSLLALDISLLSRPLIDHRTSVLRGAADALRFLVRSRHAGVAFSVVLVLSTFSFNVNVVFPLLASRTLHAGAGTYGLIAAIFGAGALASATINATRARASMRLLLTAAAVYGGLELVLAPQRSLPLVCALVFAIGFCYIMWATNALTSIQLAAPERLRGRSASLYFFAFLGGAPLGGLFAGWAVSLGGTALAFYVAGIIAVIAAIVGAATLRLSRRETHAAPAS